MAGGTHLDSGDAADLVQALLRQVVAAHDPGVAQHLLGRHAHARVQVQHLLHEILQSNEPITAVALTQISAHITNKNLAARYIMEAMGTAYAKKRDSVSTRLKQNLAQ